MYNLAVTGEKSRVGEIQKLFGDKYDLTDDLSQANVLAVNGKEAEIPDSKLLFAVLDMTEIGLSEGAATTSFLALQSSFYLQFLSLKEENLKA